MAAATPNAVKLAALAAAITVWLAFASGARAQTPTEPPTTPPPPSAPALPLADAPQLMAPGTGARGRIVRRAEAQLGYVDHGSYCTKFGPCEVWCALFATWVWRGAGVPIASLGFTGSIYDWATANTYVTGRRALPKPGDAVLIGTSPATVGSSRHVGIVEAVFPRYLVTIEGDTDHGVHRFVVPLRNPQSVGEPGPIYAYASPFPRALSVSRAAAPARAEPFAGPALRRAIAAQDVRMKLTPTDIRLRAAIKALRAFQQMPYRDGTTTIGWYGIDPAGRPQVAVIDQGDLAHAQQAWLRFLVRRHDDGAAYAVSFYTAQP